MALPTVNIMEDGVTLDTNKRTRGPDKGPRAPVGFKKLIEEVAQTIFSQTRISVEGATKSVIPSIPLMIQDISDDIRTGSIEKFKLSLNKLEKLIDTLGIDLKKYNKGLAQFLDNRQKSLVESQEKIIEIRQKGATAEIDTITGTINYLSREEIKLKNDELVKTLADINKLKRDKDREEKKLQTSRFLSEEEIKTKKQFVEDSYNTLETLEKSKVKLMETLNVKNEDNLPRPGLFSRVRGRVQRAGEGVREYTPDFILNIFDQFTNTIKSFFDPLIMLKDIVFDILKPLKIFNKLLGPIVSSMGKYLKVIGRQIVSGLALVAVNLLRILTDKKVLIGLLAVAGALGLKKLIEVAGDKVKGNVEEKAKEQEKAGNIRQATNIRESLKEKPEYLDSRGNVIKFGEAKSPERIKNDFLPMTKKPDSFKIKPGSYEDKMLKQESKSNITNTNAISNNLSNVQTQNTASVANVSTSGVSRKTENWVDAVYDY